MSGSPEDLELSLNEFRKRMSATCFAWWTGKIRSLEQDDSLTDKQRLDELSRYMGLKSWSEGGHGASVTSPSQLLLPPDHPEHVDLAGIRSDHVGPPQSPESRSTFLASLSNAVNGIAGHDIPLPDEFLRFLELTDGVSGGHLAEFMPCGLGGTFLGGTLPREWMRGGTESDGWSVLTGWCTAMEKDDAETQLLYARKAGGTAEEAQWQWRVCVEDWSEDPCSDGRWFTSIADFLEHMAGWFERLPDGWEHERKYVPGLSDSEDDSDEDSDESD